MERQKNLCKKICDGIATTILPTEFATSVSYSMPSTVEYQQRLTMILPLTHSPALLWTYDLQIDIMLNMRDTGKRQTL
jgi:hypothetical protein